MVRYGSALSLENLYLSFICIAKPAVRPFVDVLSEVSATPE
jgi:hypothetical protein